MDINYLIPPNDILSHFYKDLSQQVPHKSHNQQNQFDPYVNNQGTCIGVGGPGFCIIAGDTRMSLGYDILSRNTSRISNLTSSTFLGTSGMYADFTALCKMMDAQLKMYEFKMGREASTQSIAQLLCNTLYGKRFFPYYTFNLLAGLDENGDGVLFGYDAIGSFDKVKYGCQGSGQKIIMPLLDQQMTGYNKKNAKIPQTKEEVIDLILDAFHSCAERDIYTGDQIELILIEKNNVQKIFYPLRKD